MEKIPQSTRDRLLKDLMQTMMEKLMEAERTDYLGFDYGAPKMEKKWNSRNGYRFRDLQTGLGLLEALKVPRDRAGKFAPILLREFERRTERIDDLILCLYAKGMSTRDIGDVLKAIYGKEASAQTITNLTKGIEEERKAWCNRRLSKRYVALFVDAIMVKIRREVVASDAIYLILGITAEGRREVLALVAGASESASEWQEIFKDIKKRGAEEILVVVMDGLAGLEEGAKAVFPRAMIQGCVVHQNRATLARVRPRHKEAVAEDLRSIYRSKSLEEAKDRLTEVKFKWRQTYPRIFFSWEENLPKLMTFLEFPEALRPIIYTTNWIERLNKELRKVTKTKNSFPTEDAVLNLLYLKLKDISDRWDGRKLRGFEKYQLELEELWERRYPKRRRSFTHKG